MPARSFNGMEYAEPACPTQGNDIAIHTRLGPQEFQSGVNIFRCTAALRAAAFTEPTHVEGESVDSCVCELRSQRVPRFAVAIALMQQQQSGTRPARHKVGSLQWSTVGG